MKDNTPGYNDFRIAVPSQFEEVFTHLYFAENKTDVPVTKILLPSYRTILIFNFGKTPFLESKGNTRLEVDKYLVIGPVKQAFQYTLPTGAEILIVNFKDDAFYRFFRNIDIAEHVPISPHYEDCFHVLWYELSKIKDVYQRADHILKSCEPYMTYRNKIAEQLANFKEQTLNPIKAISSENKQTERNTQLNHKRHFGFSAKEHNRYQRFLKAIELIDALALSDTKVNWFEIVDECGYYDQSQLIHDFKHYINLSPVKYLQFQQDICNPIT